MVALSVELIVGWSAIIVLGWALGRSTRIFHRMVWGPVKLGKAAVGTRNRVLGLAGFTGGLWLGPELFAIGATMFGSAIGGLAGALAFQGLGLTLKQTIIAGLIALIVIGALAGEAADAEDD